MKPYMEVKIMLCLNKIKREITMDKNEYFEGGLF
jgi:hypothetical protein